MTTGVQFFVTRETDVFRVKVFFRKRRSEMTQSGKGRRIEVLDRIVGEKPSDRGLQIKLFG